MPGLSFYLLFKPFFSPAQNPQPTPLSRQGSGGACFNLAAHGWRAGEEISPVYAAFLAPPPAPTPAGSEAVPLG